MNRRQSILLLGAGLGLLTGCAHLPRAHEAFAGRPRAYQRVDVLPVVFIGSSDLDASLTLTDQQRLNRDMGALIAATLAEALTAKGYRVLAPPQVLGAEEDWQSLTPTIRELLAELAEESQTISAAIWRNQRAERRQPFRYRFGTRLDDLRHARGSLPADAVVLVRSEAYYHSPEGVVNRLGYAALFGMTGGLAGMVAGPAALQQREYILHQLTVIDPRSRAVLWFDLVLWPDRSARNSNLLRHSVRHLVRPLPVVR